MVNRGYVKNCEGGGFIRTMAKSACPEFKSDRISVLSRVRMVKLISVCFLAKVASVGK